MPGWYARHQVRIVGLIAALVLCSIGAPARSETREAEDARVEAAGVDSRSSDDEDRQQPRWPRRRGRGLRLAGSIVLGVGYAASVALAADTVHDGVMEGWPGFVPLLGPAVAAGTGNEAVYEHAREDARTNLEPVECTEDSSFCGLGRGLMIETSATLSESYWVTANVLLAIVQIVGAVLMTAGHLLGARSHARSRGTRPTLLTR